MDMSGNVWEWQANHSNFETKDFYVRGGAWGANQVYARIRSASSVNGSECGITNGFRIVAVPSLASNI
jgi:formylglycine-generating enzyme required for sulfatase activity